MSRILTFVFALAALLALPLPEASAAPRVALIIGNAAYGTSPLANPVNDAQAMARTLENLGFEVIHRSDLDLPAMDEALEAFYRRLQGAEAGLFYFAGHGIQSGGENYLIPVDSRVRRERDLRYYALPAGRVLGIMEEAGAPVNIVILDACRDNPFKSNFRSASRGLAVVQAVRGSFVAFATSPGAVAADGDGDNGVFTKHILANIATTGLSIEDVFRRVRKGVVAETKGGQTPWDSSSLTGRFAFASSVPAAAPAKAEPARSDTFGPDPAQLAMAEELKKMRREMEALRQSRNERDAAELAALKAEMEKMRRERSSGADDVQVTALMAEVERLKAQQASGGQRDDDGAQMAALRRELERLKASAVQGGAGPAAEYTVAALPVSIVINGVCSYCNTGPINNFNAAVREASDIIFPVYSGSPDELPGSKPFPAAYKNIEDRLLAVRNCDAQGMSAVGRDLGVDAVIGFHFHDDSAANDTYTLCMVDSASGDMVLKRKFVPYLPGNSGRTGSALKALFRKVLDDFRAARGTASAQ